MGFTELFFIAVGLSMDAFAVALCKGLNMKKINFRHGVIIALFFGTFQGLMPLLGWAVGIQFERYITDFDHWIAFALLCFIGINMVREALKKDEEECEYCDTLNIKELTVMAVATSIDALSVGVTFAFLPVKILPACGLIALTTFCLSLFGVVVGNKFGLKYKEKAELFGGGVLILIGCKILAEHLGWF
ncbi:MAG: manganese efflux pump MntP family protein [Oscillospiraceae bacterium]